MHAITGKAGAATFATFFNAKLTSWDLELKAENVVDRGSGEAWQSKVYLYSDWEANVEAYMPDVADRYCFSSNEALFSTVGALALKPKSADTNVLFAANGLFDNFRVESPIDNDIKLRAHFTCSEGVAPVILTAHG